jgi:hypothetical protein
MKEASEISAACVSRSKIKCDKTPSPTATPRIRFRKPFAKITHANKENVRAEKIE